MLNQPIELKAQWGIGDTIMHRAVVRELMKTRDVYLRTHLPALFIDLIENGLKISSGRPDNRPFLLRATTDIPITPAPFGTEQRLLTYRRDGSQSILATGSVLASQFASLNLPMPEAPDLRFTNIPGQWLDKARRLIKGRPFMIARPPVTHKYFSQPMRNPDPHAYTTLYNSIRQDFYTFGVANFTTDMSAAAPDLQFDSSFLNGELDLETLVGLFAEADLVFSPLCFAPWLAQATETPLVTVFGGIEGALTTIGVTAPLSPTLAIEAKHQCNCHRRNHACDKTIDVDAALPRLQAFVAQHVSTPRVHVESRLCLPDVSLVCVETRAHELSHVAIADITGKVKFGDVLIYTDKPDAIPAADAKYTTVPNWPDKIQMGAFYYGEAAYPITTSHALLMEWDAGIRDVGMWDPAFLEYDYIGAPWLPSCCKVKGMTVGNGGFTLISKRLAGYIYANRQRLSVNTDIAIAQYHRPEFESAIGAKWAPEDVARRFSYELGNCVPSFGYHGVFNWPLALSQDEVNRRVSLVAANPYARESKTRLLARPAPRDPTYRSNPNQLRELYLRQQQHRGIRA